MDQNAVSTNPVTPASTAPVSDIPTPGVPVSDAPAPKTDTDESNISNPAAAFAPPAPAVVENSPVVTPDLDYANIPSDAPAASTDLSTEVAKKIAESQNVLVALSSDPSVDEMAAAIGLSLFLDKLGKRATAIYSGSTPNALEFLKPEETFESTADTLQDFVIALNKDKADHLRYKLDGDYVKIFITPYKTRIGEDDLEFSYGDFNVDLVLALDVANGIDLDAALREHGRIMHDAVIVNITTGNPGKLGEIEWSDKSASSVSEMIAKLLYSVSGKVKLEKEEATAFLTGIVAATNRFSNAKTTPYTMQIASRLMESGANQQLISQNITPDIDNELYSLLGDNAPKRDNDPTKLDIEHGSEESADESKEVDATITEENSTLLDDLKAAEASLAQAGSETVPDLSNQPIKLDGASTEPTEPVESPGPTASVESTPTSDFNIPAPVIPAEPVDPAEPVAAPGLDEPSLPPILSPDETLPEQEGTNKSGDKPEKVIQPSTGVDFSAPDEGTEKYGKMLEDAISGLGESAAEPTEPIMSDNPASTMAPTVASTPEINGVPEMNYMPLPGEEVLPPPPTPPIDMNTPATESAMPTEPLAPIEPAAPAPETTPEAPTSLGPQPAMQDQVYTPQAADPGAFKIPGM